MEQLAEEELIQQLCEEAGRQLVGLFEESTKEKLKKLAKRMIGRRQDPKDPVFWPAGLLLLGLVESGREEALSAAESYLEAWIQSGSPLHFVDDALTGYVLVRLFRLTGKEEWKTAAAKIRDFLLALPVDERGSIIYNAGRGNAYIFADGAGQSSLFLASYGAAFSDEKAMSLAKVQVQNFLQQGMDATTGLNYHGFDAKSGVKYGIIGWGRAAAWLFMGLTAVAVHTKDPKILSDCRQFAGNVTRCRRKDDLFSWQLTALEGPADTSATGMLWWAMMQGCHAGILDAELLGSAADVASALTRQISGGRVLQSSAECIDFGEYRQQYGTYPWGQGAVLAFLSCRLGETS